MLYLDAVGEIEYRYIQLIMVSFYHGYTSKVFVSYDHACYPESVSEIKAIFVCAHRVHFS